MGGVVAKGHAPALGRAGQHVEVVERVTGGGYARPVVAAWDAKDVAVADHDIFVDAPVRGVGAMKGKALRGGPGRAVAPDAEVVDLLVVHRALGGSVVAVRWVRRPVAVGGQKLHAHQPVSAVEDAGGHEVGDLAGRRSRPPDFDGDLAGFDVDGVETAPGPGGGQGDFGASRRAKPHLGPDRDVRPVGHPGEDAVPAGEAQDAPLDVDFDAPGQREHGHLLVAGDKVEVVPRGQVDHPQTGVRPARHLRGQADGEPLPVSQGTGRPVQSRRRHSQPLSGLTPGPCPGQGPGRPGPGRPARRWRP